MTLTAGTLVPCESRSGGLVKLFAANRDDVDVFTLSGGKYTAVAMNGGAVFFEFEFEQDTAERRENGSIENGSSKYIHEIEFFIPKLTTDNRNRLQELMDASPCGVIFIAEDANGLKWVVGYSEKFLKKRALRLQSDASLSGKTFTDLNGSTIIMLNEDTTKDVEFTGVVPV